MPGIKRSSDGLRKSADEDSSSEASEQTTADPQRKRQRRSAETESNVSDELTDEETLNNQATQFHHWQNEKSPQVNQPQENGIIESITCTNFMCHDYLQVDIGPLINFIIGHNGSGKSAVLTALTVCLGGKASATNRAGSLKAFVKAGQESCTVAVNIKNQGETAYQPTLYGDTIIVERSFNTAGTSGFKLKSSNGKVISTRRSDLEDITDFYALQLDNPMSVLTQDNARQFLNASTPADKYKFFMKGVQLEQLNQDYELLQESIQQVENTFEDKQTHVQQLEQKKLRAESNWNALVRADNIRDEINVQRVKMAWVQVQDQEIILDGLERDLEAATIRQERHLEKVEQISREFDLKCQAEDIAQGRTSELEAELESKKEEKKEITAEYQGVKEERMNSHREQRQIGDRIKGSKEAIIRIEKDIQDEYRRLEEVNGGSHARMLAQLEKRQQEIKHAQERLQEYNAGLPRLQDLQRNAESAVEKQKGTRAAKEQELKACEDRLKELRQQGSRRNGFPPNMNALLDAISRESNFQERPVGPIANYIQLTEPIWSSILERSIGGTLNGFVVTSKADQSRLHNVMQRVNCKCPILIGSRGLLNTEGHEPDSTFVTIQKVLQFNSDLVKRQLIINQGIDQTLLVEDYKQATRLMHNGGERLRNVRQCFSINANHTGCGIRFAYGQGTGLKSDPINAYKDPPRIKTQIEDHISFEQNQHQRLRKDLTEIENDLRKLQAMLDECKRNIGRHAKLMQELKLDVQRCEVEAEKLQNGVDNETVEEGRLEVLKGSMESAEQEKADLERKYEDAVVEFEKHDTNLATIKRRLGRMDTAIKDAQERRDSAFALLNTASDERHEALQVKNTACEDLVKAKATMTELQESRGDTLGTIADWSSKAANIGDRIPILPEETSTSIEEKLNKLDDEIKNTEKRAGGDKRKLAEVRRVTTKNYEDALRQLRNERSLSDMLKQSLATRQERWGHFRKKIVARARCTFLHVLSERSYNGKLKIDHKTRKLEIEIQPDETQTNRQGRETTTLSGGEKSYSTICLLLSLWDAVGTPIRCLDEFDVFMDSVNRDISMKLIIRSARRSVGRQFILISPQAGIADRSRDVKIIRMRDPERNQTRLAV